jgi:hypothetical protein
MRASALTTDNLNCDCIFATRGNRSYLRLLKSFAKCSGNDLMGVSIPLKPDSLAYEAVSCRSMGP